MTRAKTLLEVFKWNPDWGKLSSLRLHRVVFRTNSERDRTQESYLFKWRGLDIVIFANDGSYSDWYYCEYHTGEFINGHSIMGDCTKEEAQKQAIEHMEETGIEKIKYQLLGKKHINPDKIEYVQ